MYTQKTSGLAGGKITPEPAGRNGSPPKTAPAATAVRSSPTAAVALPKGSPAVPHTINSLISAAGLPVDKLSASIISFARFFSLPIKPELMAAIRRQALPPSATMPLPAEHGGAVPAKAGSMFGHPALSLAAAAAQDKGVELSPKGLEAFAEAVDPDRQKRGSGGHHPHGRQHREHDRQKKEAVALGSMSASDLKNFILESAGKDPLLALMNRLPGKNGQRWIVLPFSLSESGKEFRVSLRILLDGENPAGRLAKSMVLDIVERDRRWLFVPTVTVTGPAGISMSRFTLYLQPGLPPRDRDLIARQLSPIMGIPPDCITVNNVTEPFPCEADSGNELYAVNEAV